MAVQFDGVRQTVRPEARLWAYLSDPMPTGGSAEIFEQKRIIDAIASWSGRSIDRYVVDSGSTITADGYGARLELLLSEVHDSDHDTIFILSDLTHLAVTRDGRQRAVAALLSAGFVVKDRTGALHPTPETVALAEAAAVRPSAKERRRAGRGHDDV